MEYCLNFHNGCSVCAGPSGHLGYIGQDGHNICSGLIGLGRDNSTYRTGHIGSV